MRCLAVLLIAFACLSPSAFASLARPKDGASLTTDLRPAATRTIAEKTWQPQTTSGPKAQLVITEQTEVKLDGRPCCYQDVPHGATVVGAETGLDNRTILRIHFRTKQP
jgi:hypothetical protein